MTKLTEQNYQNAAELLGCETAAIKAVAEVESKGEGFYPDGFPVILFERHKFSKYTGGKFDKTYPEISNKKAGGYGPAGANQRRKFGIAFTLNPEAAMKSCSWGKFQIMGFNYADCGFESVGKFVDAMRRSEGEHLLAFCRFVQSQDLVRFLKAKNWARFAHGYNGEDYRENRYDEKMAAAYKKHLPANKQMPQMQRFAEISTTETGLLANKEVADSFPSNEEQKEAMPESFLIEAFDKNVSADQLKLASRSAGQKAWAFLLRPAGLLYTALEAGNIAAWLGVVVLIAAVGLLIYWHRNDIRKLVDKLKGKLRS